MSVCESRDGRGGGPPRTGGGAITRGRSPVACSVFRRGRAGGGAGSTGVLPGRGGIEGRFGIVPLPLPLTLALTAWATTGSVAVRTGGGGGGGRLPAVDGGAWKFFCLFNAAMRSASVVSWGSSTSAIFEMELGELTISQPTASEWRDVVGWTFRCGRGKKPNLHRFLLQHTSLGTVLSVP